jgi:hypothetical protein
LHPARGPDPGFPAEPLIGRRPQVGGEGPRRDQRVEERPRGQRQIVAGAHQAALMRSGYPHIIDDQQVGAVTEPYLYRL